MPLLRGWPRAALGLLAGLALAGCAGTAGPAVAPPAVLRTAPPAHPLIPAPESVSLAFGDTLVLTASTPIVVDAGDAEARRVGEILAEIVGESPEARPPVVEAGGAVPPGSLRLTRSGADASLGEEGYALDIRADGVLLTARTAAGLFYGVQTLRQLLPAGVEYGAARGVVRSLPLGRVVDRPQYRWRGMMLDVARHFFGPDDVKRLVDLMALYKLNRLHLHLSDDQGWRIEVPGRPTLTAIGGSSEVGGGPGGFYTTAEYADLVAYAARRFITIVPEIDLPGHTNAALASIPELNCDGVAPPLYTGIRVGFSSVCVDREETYAFVDDVVRHLASFEGTPFVHIGGDEVKTLTPEEYRRFMDRAQQIVVSHGARVVGWDELAEADVVPGAVVQVWRPQRPGAAPEAIQRAVEGGATVVLSPADHVYLDMKYDSTTVLGLTWAGINDVRDAYDWEPATLLPGVPASAIEGVEAPLWAETLTTIRDIEFMAFPRLAGVAEIGWTRGPRRWDEYRTRLAAHGPRWSALGVNAYRWRE